jgi:hypothetical protein
VQGSSGSAGSGGAAGLAGGAGTGNTSIVSEFTSGMDGWLSGFSDYPPNQETFYELQCQQAPLPAGLAAGSGVLVRGNNHSDDLFMYLTREITGLLPTTNYRLDVRVEIGTNAPSDCGGIGGSPGTSVHFKIGASATKPTSTSDGQGILRLNLDKGQQSVGGADLKVVGDISNSLHCPDSTYQTKTLSLSGFSVRSAANGSLWLVVGTDSGFEGLTSLYYDKITATLSPGN